MKIIILIVSFLLLSGCMGSKDSKNETTNTNTKYEAPMNDVVQSVEDNIDNMLNYWKEKGIEIMNQNPIEAMDFAAYEGISFMYNGAQGYLYRLRSDDSKMKALLESARETGKVKVNIDGKEQEYQANVNNDYILIYENGSNMKDISSILGNYDSNKKYESAPSSNNNPTNQASFDQTNPSNEQQNEQ